MVRGLLAGDPPLACLAVAIHCARAGELQDARDFVSRALAHERSPALVALVAGLVRFVARDYQGSLDAFELAAADPRAATRAYRELTAAAGSLGWDQDVRTLLERAVEAEPNSPRWHAEAVRFHERGRNYEAAAKHARAALELAPTAAGLWMQLAKLCARQGEAQEAGHALAQALEHTPPEAQPEDQASARSEAALIALDAGLWEIARTHLHWTTQHAPTPEAWVWLGELAAWEGDGDEAVSCAERALALAPEHGGAHRLLGGQRLLAGDVADGIERFKRALEADPRDNQAHAWMAQALLAKGDYRGVDRHLRSATMRSGGFFFVAWMLRFMLVAAEDQGQLATITPNRTEEFGAVLPEAAGELGRRALETRDRAETIAAVELALERMRGNRSIYASYVDDAGLQRVKARTGCRHASRWALQLIRVATPEQCLAQFDAIMADYPESSLPVCHRGELALWLGRFDEAKRDLETAIELLAGTRWAYIGLSTFGLLDGDPQASLEMNARGVEAMRNTEGPAVHVYRGEAYRRLGQLDQALAELKKADELHPARASAAINLALTYAALERWDDVEPLWLRLRDDQCPGLMGDAARELDLAIVGNVGFEASRTTIVAVLERALAMMGGNRSSGLITYWTAAGQLRFVSKWPHGGAKPHDRDEQRLMQAQDLLNRASGARRVRR